MSTRSSVWWFHHFMLKLATLLKICHRPSGYESISITHLLLFLLLQTNMGNFHVVGSYTGRGRFKFFDRWLVYPRSIFEKKKKLKFFHVIIKKNS